MSSYRLLLEFLLITVSVFAQQYVDLGLGGGENEDVDFYRAQFVEDKMYYTTYHWDEETGDSSQILHVYSFADKKDVGSFVLSENKNDEETKIYHSADSYVVRSDGSIAMVENTYDNTDEENPKRSSALCLYDADFQKENEIDLMEAVKSDGDDFYVSQFIGDSDDRLYVVADSKIYLFDKDLSFKGNVDSGDSWISASGKGKDGKVYISMYDQGSNGEVVRQVDFEQKKLGEAHTGFLSGNGNSLTPGLEGDFLLSDGTRVYDYSLEENKATELFAWLDCDIFGDYVRGMFVTEDGRIAVTINDWGNGETSLAYLSKVKTAELPQKTQLTMGSLYGEQELQAAAVAFNKQSDKYHISMKCYMDMTSNDEDSYKNGITAMNNALISTDVPDMVMVTPGLNVSSTIQQFTPNSDVYSTLE